MPPKRQRESKKFVGPARRKKQKLPSVQAMKKLVIQQIGRNIGKLASTLSLSLLSPLSLSVSHSHISLSLSGEQGHILWRSPRSSSRRRMRRRRRRRNAQGLQSLYMYASTVDAPIDRWDSPRWATPRTPRTQMSLMQRRFYTAQSVR
jgi:hypothetical protein